MSRIPKSLKLSLRPLRSVLALDPEIRELEAQRAQFIRLRRQRLLLMGAVISISIHILLMLILNTIYRWQPAGVGRETVQYEFAILSQEELTELDQINLDKLTSDAIAELEILPEESAELTADIPAVEMEFATSGSMPTLGGSGSGESFGLSGGGAGTSFFGVSSSGTRFAYIVDKSGSMGNGTKMDVAKRELARSIQSLPDYAQFFVVMFANSIKYPPFQEGWMKAKKSTVARVIRWLNNEVDPGGGTEPRTAFHLVFNLDAVGGRPDVIFFLTDGEITDFSAEEIAALNDRGKRVVINTIAFGDPSSQNLLKKIASQSGGVYRFVSVRGR